MLLRVCSNDHAMLTVMPIYSSSKLRTAEMMIISLVAAIGLDKCCITSAYLQWLCHSDERAVARGPLVLLRALLHITQLALKSLSKQMYSERETDRQTDRDRQRETDRQR